LQEVGHAVAASYIFEYCIVRVLKCVDDAVAWG